MTREKAEIILQSTFGINKFYDTQWDVIERIWRGERVLLIEKTGYGKSLCFQFPASLFKGTTIVFSPLIALMRDQVSKLNKLGINAKCINSNQEIDVNKAIIEDALENKIKILYIAPERMENIEWINTARQLKISMVVVDEAHCISTWGHDFRPAYKRIINLVNLLPSHFPVLATTATATTKVEEDIKLQIGKNVTSYRGNLLRNNLRLFVINVESEEEKMIWLGQFLNKIDGSGIIYTGTRADTEIYSRWLNSQGVTAAYYNAELDASIREDIEKGLMENRWKCVVSTNALGMGIDKPDIRFIIHTQTPISPIHYYQEIGRAGRDGKNTFIILFYNPDKDFELPLAFIEGNKPSIDKYQRVIDTLSKNLLGEQDLMRETNLKRTELRIIKSDLIDQGIINEVIDGRAKKFEKRFKAPELNTAIFEEYRQKQLNDFYNMVNYIETTGCRMKFLCNYLGDNTTDNCSKCDNDTKNKKKVIVTEEWEQKIMQFNNNYFPVLDVATVKSNLINGVAGSYYGFSNIGTIIHKCKYEQGGDYPDHLLRIVVSAYNKHLKNNRFDLILYVPPTLSGELVKNFAVKLSNIIKIPISDKLFKQKITKPQKSFQNNILKKENVKDVFLYQDSNEIKEKNILLIDDIFDSGATIKEIGKYLTGLGAKLIVPLVIAKTVGGDISAK
jgi:ATP-dependent DNA helicase RecQ